MKSKERIPTAEEIADHCLIAFGAGAGTQNVAPGAIRALRSQYFGPVTSLAGTWEKDGEAVLINARELGRICAEVAGGAGKMSIDVAQLRLGAKELRKLWQSQALIHCPCDQIAAAPKE